MRFKKGDIVKISKKSKYYSDDAANPRDMEGKIREFKSAGLPIGIDWDNGRGNYYNEKDLRLVRREDA